MDNRHSSRSAAPITTPAAVEDGMSNYPPGMTSHAWEHIEGKEHHSDCPEHEDNDGGGCDCDRLIADAYEDAMLRRWEERRDEGLV